MHSFVKPFVADESGATAMEYGLMVALIAVALLTAIIAVGHNIEDTFNNIANQFG